MLQTFQEFGQSCSCSFANELFNCNIATQALKDILCSCTFTKISFYELKSIQPYASQSFFGTIILCTLFGSSTSVSKIKFQDI